MNNITRAALLGAAVVAFFTEHPAAGVILATLYGLWTEATLLYLDHRAEMRLKLAEDAVHAHGEMVRRYDQLYYALAKLTDVTQKLLDSAEVRDDSV